MQKYLVVLLVAAVALLAVPAMAQAPAPAKTVDFYAQIWWDAFYEKDDARTPSGPYRDPSQDQTYYNKKQQGFETKDFSWGVDPIATRLGVNFKQDNLTGKYEIRPFGDGGNANLIGVPKWSSTLREAWAQYEFKDVAGIKVLLGQTYCPLYLPIYTMAQGGMNTWAGDLRPEDRTPMLQVQVPTGEIGSVKVALIRPNQAKIASSLDTKGTKSGYAVIGGIVYDNYSTAPVTYFDYYSNPFPKVEAAYNLKMTAGVVKVDATAGAGYQQEKAEHQLTDAVGEARSVVVKSYVYGATGKVSFGPLEVRGSYHASTNGNEFSDGDVLAKSFYNYAEDKLYDAKAWGAHGVIMFTVDKFSFYASRGMNKGKIDKGSSAAGGKIEYDAYWTSAGVIIKNLLPGLILQPEFAVKDNGETKTTTPAGVVTKANNGTQRYAGVCGIIYL